MKTPTPDPADTETSAVCTNVSTNAKLTLNGISSKANKFSDKKKKTGKEKRPIVVKLKSLAQPTVEEKSKNEELGVENYIEITPLNLLEMLRKHPFSSFLKRDIMFPKKFGSADIDLNLFSPLLKFRLIIYSNMGQSKTILNHTSNFTSNTLHIVDIDEQIMASTSERGFPPTSPSDSKNEVMPNKNEDVNVSVHPLNTYGRPKSLRYNFHKKHVKASNNYSKETKFSSITQKRKNNRPENINNDGKLILTSAKRSPSSNIFSSNIDFNNDSIPIVSVKREDLEDLKRIYKVGQGYSWLDL